MKNFDAELLFLKILLTEKPLIQILTACRGISQPSHTRLIFSQSFENVICSAKI